jgi:hypothetical protein
LDANWWLTARRRPEINSRGYSTLQTGMYALAYHGSLELSEGAGNLEHQLSHL